MLVTHGIHIVLNERCWRLGFSQQIKRNLGTSIIDATISPQALSVEYALSHVLSCM